YAPNARGADRHDVGVQHHERQSPIAFQGMFQVKADDGLLFPRLQPEITGNPTVVFIDAPVAASPVVELAGLEEQTYHLSPLNLWGLNEHNGWIPRDFWLQPWEKQAI